ncbi:uncharacterized protein PG998_010522 [Apiospora kogelbergensis]|uniref:uncharacterized protein n=1 Tax=Apiospora kogelbergensis TaxID=1337665 RepID=UPI00313159D1
MSMAYLCQRRGFKVYWTSNLADHLNVNWRYKTITVYEHKIFLWNTLQYSSNSLTPPWILVEAIDTLNVLFPLGDEMTNKLLQRHSKVLSGIGYCGSPRHKCLDLAKFSIWRDSMADLVEIMNEEPSGVRQLALESDGRNMLPFLTFWVAIVVATLGVLSIPFAIVSMKYTVKQYDLALAQACSAPGAQDSLPHYCN